MKSKQYINEIRFELPMDVVALGILQMAVIVEQLLFSLLYYKDIYLKRINVTQIRVILHFESITNSELKVSTELIFNCVFLRHTLHL
jgi:hypothetical protein